MTPAEQLEAAAPDVRKNILYLIHNYVDESDEMYKPGNTVAFAQKIQIPRNTLVRLLDEKKKKTQRIRYDHTRAIEHTCGLGTDTLQMAHAEFVGYYANRGAPVVVEVPVLRTIVESWPQNADLYKTLNRRHLYLYYWSLRYNAVIANKITVSYTRARAIELVLENPRYEGNDRKNNVRYIGNMYSAFEFIYFWAGPEDQSHEIIQAAAHWDRASQTKPACGEMLAQHTENAQQKIVSLKFMMMVDPPSAICATARLDRAVVLVSPLSEYFAEELAGTRRSAY
jgi:hypothetical protein